MWVVDEDTVFSELVKARPRRVLFTAPDGLLHHTCRLAERVRREFGVEALVVADPCYGSCDLIECDAERLNADLVFHIGHGVSVSRVGRRTVMIDAYSTIEFDEVLRKAIPMLNNDCRVGLCTISPHLHQLDRVKERLEERGFRVVVGHGRGRLRDGQVLGCEFHTAYGVRGLVDLFLFLGQSMFHAVAVRMATGRRVLMLDPYMNSVVDVKGEAVERMKRAMLAIYRALDAERFGVIVGLREGQTAIEKAVKLRERLEDLGREAELIAMREVSGDRLNQLKHIDAFIQTACPRISIDNYTYPKPLLSTPQAEALLRLMNGGSLSEDFLEMASWL